MNKVILFLFFYLFLINGKVLSQSLPFINLTTDDGLAQSTVFSIFQDSNGFMWFGTENGVSKYDGIRFTNYELISNNSPFSARIIREDYQGNIWIGTRGGGLFKFDGNNLFNYRKDSVIPGNVVTAIFNYGDKKLWFAFRDLGIYEYNGSSFSKINELDSLLGKNIISIFRDSKNNLWFGTRGNGVYMYSNKVWKIFNTSNGLSSNTITEIFEDSKKRIWFASLDNGITYLSDGKFNIITKDNGLPNNQINSVFEDKSGSIWIATLGGIVQYHGDKLTIFAKRSGLMNEFIISGKVDREGNLWFGTYGDGIIKLTTQKFNIYSEKNGLSNNIILSIIEDKNKNFYIGTFGGGLNKIEGDKIFSYDQKSGLNSNIIWSLKFNFDGELLIGTNKGLYKFNGISFVSVPHKEIKDRIIYTVFVDKNFVWLGTNAGIFRLKNPDLKLQNDTLLLNLSKSTSIISIFKDSRNYLWFGTDGKGLIKYDGKNYDIFSKENGLASNTINGMCEDDFGNMWISTPEGISKFNGIKDFQNFTTKDGLSSNLTYFIINHKNFIYVGTVNGISKFSPADLVNNGKLNFTYFTAKNGLASSEMNIGACYEDSEGKLWFGSTRGVTRFDPELDKINDVPPIVHITSIYQEDKDIFKSKMSEFNYKQNSFRFEFVGISLTTPERVEYQYIIDGLEKNWSTTRERTISYSSLPPGTYTFKVRAKNADGFWSKNVAAYSFKINPPWWETLWFRSLAIGLIISGFLGFYFYRINAIKRINIKLENMVKQRTHELQLEKDRSENLLLNILPASIVKELKEKGETIPRKYESSSILFTDFANFTQIASGLTPEQLVYELNDIFKVFDSIIEKYKLEKLKTIGDAYMIGSGLPEVSDDHAYRLVKAAIEMLDFLNNRNKQSKIQWNMRVGIHSGKVVAGVVGRLKFTYDIWGDSVNVASRMEKNCEPGRINISEDTYLEIKDYFNCEYRGKIEVKGKGKMDMYYIIGEK